MFRHNYKQEKLKWCADLSMVYLIFLHSTNTFHVNVGCFKRGAYCFCWSFMSGQIQLERLSKLLHRTVNNLVAKTFLWRWQRMQLNFNLVLLSKSLRALCWREKSNHYIFFQKLYLKGVISLVHDVFRIPLI